jgi:hypothetical protein
MCSRNIGCCRERVFLGNDMNKDQSENRRVPQPLVLSKVEAAKREMTEAEADIEKLLRELRANARAEKTTISEVLEAAFNRVLSARGSVDALKGIIDTELDES